MSIYAVCHRFVEEACKSSHYALNVLFHFVMDNDLRVAVDAGESRVLALYGQTCKKYRSKEVQVWLRNLAADRPRNIEEVRVDAATEPEALCLAVARAMAPPRRFIVWSREHYRDAETGISLIDRQAAKAAVGSAKGTTGETHVTKKYDITAGHGSNIVIGSTLSDSLKHLNTAVSEKAAATLKATADCVEASGDEEAGDLVDKLAAEVSQVKPNEKSLLAIAGELFEKVPDLAKVAGSAVDLVKILLGTAS